MPSHWNWSFTRNIIKPIASNLEKLTEDMQECIDPDSFGLIDEYESMLGIGFAVCQTFLTSVHQGENKSEWFQEGPFHKNGMSYALITNTAANYWKHHEEWNQNQLTGIAKNNIKLMNNLGVDVWKSYPLCDLMYELRDDSDQCIFFPLLDKLNEWSAKTPQKA